MNIFNFIPFLNFGEITKMVLLQEEPLEIENDSITLRFDYTCRRVPDTFDFFIIYRQLPNDLDIGIENLHDIKRVSSSSDILELVVNIRNRNAGEKRNFELQLSISLEEPADENEEREPTNIIQIQYP